MKKIGILTYHNSDNYGSLLQCFALKTLIEQLGNYEVYTINYSCINLLNYFETESLRKEFEKKFEKFRIFSEKYLNLSGDRIEKLKEENCPEYDYFIVGSDTVWQTPQNKDDSTYFLDFVPEGKIRIAYAASTAGNSQINLSLFEKYLPEFDYLSVRETKTRNLLQTYTETKIEVCLDPVLLLDKDEFIKLECESCKQEKDYLVLYLMYGGNNVPYIVNFANMVSTKYNLEVVHFFPTIPEYVFNKKAKDFAFDAPQDFVNYIKNAKMVITNSFHGTVFSILFNVPFYSFYNKNGGERIKDLLQLVDLHERLISEHKKLETVHFNIDWEHANNKLAIEKEKSIQFLRKALETE